MDTQGFTLVKKQKKFGNFENTFLGYRNFRRKFFISKFHHLLKFEKSMTWALTCHKNYNHTTYKTEVIARISFPRIHGNIRKNHYTHFQL